LPRPTALRPARESGSEANLALRTFVLVCNESFLTFFSSLDIWLIVLDSHNHRQLKIRFVVPRAGINIQ
jgi:hypothetical protein